jgi:hypothetical protein
VGASNAWQLADGRGSMVAKKTLPFFSSSTAFGVTNTASFASTSIATPRR